MRRLLESKLFPFVIKPGRYAGGETGQVVKDPQGRTSYLHAYPDLYEIGHSYVGLQTLYHVVNSDDRFLCERAFSVDLDAEEIMRREKIPLFSLESSRAAKGFDAFGFTLVDELVITNMLNMLDLAGFKLRAADRDENDPIILAGGPAVYNPEPLAPFVDLVFIGDGEEGLIELLTILHEQRDRTKADRLETIAREIKSAYVPRFYDEHAKPIADFAPEKITARVVTELKPDYYPEQPLVPLIDTVHNHLSVEIMRGCPQGCKFCFAAPIYKPVRPRSVNELVSQVEQQLANTGYDNVSLLSLSTTDYPHLEPLLSKLETRLKDQRVSVSLPSLRPGSVSPELLKSLKTVRKSGLTIAPEAGSERLRTFIRKDFPNEAIYDTTRIAFSLGWNTIKLYFMVGLPTETTEDLLAIARMCRKVFDISQEFTRRANINVTLSPFVPKAHTPFQWDEAIPEVEVFERIKLVKRECRVGHVHFKHNSSHLATLSALIGRSGRTMADVIESAYRKGCKFDRWTDRLLYDTWMQTMIEHGIDPAQSMKPIPFDRQLPWAHIDKGVSTDHLMEQRKKTSHQLAEYEPQYRPVTEETRNEPTTMSYGRGRKKAPVRNVIAPTKNRVRLQWGKTDRFKYMSHLENLKLLERALRRAKLPVQYSQGHNPSMKLSLGPPLPLGFTSEAEYIDITLESTLMPYMIEDFRTRLPEGIDIINARAVLDKRASLNAVLNRVEYSLPLQYWADTASLKKAADSLLDRTELIVERKGKAGSKQVDIRSAVYDLILQDDNLIMVLGLGEGGYAKAGEIATYLQDGLTVPIEALPFHRRAVYRRDEHGQRIDPMEL